MFPLLHPAQKPTHILSTCQKSIDEAALKKWFNKSPAKKLKNHHVFSWCDRISVLSVVILMISSVTPLRNLSLSALGAQRKRFR